MVAKSRKCIDTIRFVGTGESSETRRHVTTQCIPGVSPMKTLRFWNLWCPALFLAYIQMNGSSVDSGWLRTRFLGIIRKPGVPVAFVRAAASASDLKVPVWVAQAVDGCESQVSHHERRTITFVGIYRGILRIIRFF